MSTIAKGLGPLLIGSEPMIIEGTTYQFRRLGMRDTMALLQLGNQTWLLGMSEGTRYLALAMADQITNAVGTSFGSLLPILAPLLGVPIAKDWIFEFLASTLRKKVEAKGEEDWEEIEVSLLEDPLHFPMGSEIMLLERLLQHPDLLNFFKYSAGLKGNPALPLLMTLIKPKSTGAGNPS